MTFNWILLSKLVMDRHPHRPSLMQVKQYGTGKTVQVIVTWVCQHQLYW